MPKISEITNFLLKKYPLNNQEEWDNCGLFFNVDDVDCENVVIGLDVTHDLVRVAIDTDAKLIITHHPIYLNDGKEPTNDKKSLIKLLKDNKITFLCLHTCFDKAPDGTSYQILKQLPMIQKITVNKDCEYVLNAKLTKSIKLINYVEKINLKDFSVQPIVFDMTLKNKIINNLSLCAGSGSFFVNKAIFDKNIDCYLCGDIKWHDWLDANDNQFPLIDISHATEAIFIKYISELIEKNFNLKTVKVFPKIRLVSKN